MYDVIVRGGTIVTETGLVDADLAIKGSIVDAWLPRGNTATAPEVYDARGLHLFPGAIDAHAHVDLGSTEDPYQESASAAIGGVTTYLTYLMGNDPYEESFAVEKERAQRSSYVDFGFHFGAITSEQMNRVAKYTNEFGVSSYKHMMNFKGKEGAYVGVQGGDDGQFLESCERVAAVPGAVLAVHPENIEVVWKLAPRVQESGRADTIAYNDSRPPIAEHAAIQTALLFGNATGAPIYIVHLSCAEGVNEFRELRERRPSQVAYLETCPHYLTHTMFDDLGIVGRVNPPLRTSTDVEALWDGIRDGIVDVVASDHVPRKREKKSANIWESSAGFPGMGTILPVLITEGFHKRKIPLERIVQVVSRNPAEIFGMYPRKGTLRPGSDADVAIIDLNARRLVTPENLHSFSDYSLYEGREMYGFPVTTMVRGEIVVSDGNLVGTAGHGTYIGRGPAYVNTRSGAQREG